MGREIRRVVPNWQHPRLEDRRNAEGYQPLFDESAQEAWEEWFSEYQKWLDSEHEKTIKEHPDLGYSSEKPYKDFCSWRGEPPSPDYYRPKWDQKDMTWFQLYETVSEGTPLSPPFSTQDELIDYLFANGDFWEGQWTRERAEKFVKGSGWAPSMVVENGKVMDGVEFVTRD